jgi:hypothetical protein
MEIISEFCQGSSAFRRLLDCRRPLKMSNIVSQNFDFRNIRIEESIRDLLPPLNKQSNGYSQNSNSMLKTDRRNNRTETLLYDRSHRFVYIELLRAGLRVWTLLEANKQPEWTFSPFQNQKFQIIFKEIVFLFVSFLRKNRATTRNVKPENCCWCCPAILFTLYSGSVGGGNWDDRMKRGAKYTKKVKSCVRH